MDRKNLPISEPCPKNFDDMDGDGHRRFCDHCDKHVTNLSDLTRDEAMQLLSEKADTGMCVIYTFDRSNRVRFRDDLNFRRPSKSQLNGAKRLIAAAALVPLLASLPGCDTSPTAGSDSYKPIDQIIEAEKRFFHEVAELLDWNEEPDYSLVVGGLAPPPQYVMGEPAYVEPIPTPVQPIIPPTPDHVEQVQAELMGDVSPETIELLQLQALEDQ